MRYATHKSFWSGLRVLLASGCLAITSACSLSVPGQAQPELLKQASGEQIEKGHLRESQALKDQIAALQLSDVTKWQMVWAGDFGADPVSPPGLAAEFDKFIRSVSLRTGHVGGELVISSGYAGCNGIGREIRRRIVTPARTTEIIRDGKPHYTTIPATYKAYVETVMTQTGCSLTPIVNGVSYPTNWIEKMEDFIIEQIRTGTLAPNGDTLEWINEDGKVMAKYEKQPNDVASKYAK